MKRFLAVAALAAIVLLPIASVTHARKAVRANPPTPDPIAVTDTLVPYHVLEKRAVEAAQRSSVHTIDTTLVDERFDAWFRRTVGREAMISWELNDCGEQTGSPNDSDIVIPTCVQAQAEWENSTALVWLMVGTEKTGIDLDSPQVFFWEVDGRSDTTGSHTLSNFGRAVKRLRARMR